jgi:hypothetical protein
VAISPRSNETAAVLAVLESEEFDSAQSMARACVKAVAAELALRDQYIVYPPGSPVGYGPFWSETDAARAWKKEIGSSFDGQARLLRTFAWTAQDERNAECECSHPKEIHVVRGPKNKPGKPSECGRVIGGAPCPCPSFSPRKAAS